MKLSVITCTGDRQQAFSLCEKWIARQSRQPDEWIVVDDGVVPTITTMGQKVIRGTPGSKGYISLANNVIAGVKAATGDIFAFIEDDDHYDAPHLAEVYKKIEVGKHLAGCTKQRYYHLPTRSYREMVNHGSCLCQTAVLASMRDDVIAAADIAVRSQHWNIDAGIWNLARRKRLPMSLYAAPEHVVGMKGLPGRNGLGIGHRPKKDWKPDPDLVQLRQWVGEDADIYASL